MGDPPVDLHGLRHARRHGQGVGVPAPPDRGEPARRAGGCAQRDDRSRTISRSARSRLRADAEGDRLAQPAGAPERQADRPRPVPRHEAQGRARLGEGAGGRARRGEPGGLPGGPALPLGGADAAGGRPDGAHRGAGRAPARLARRRRPAGNRHRDGSARHPDRQRAAAADAARPALEPLPHRAAPGGGDRPREPRGDRARGRRAGVDPRGRPGRPRRRRAADERLDPSEQPRARGAPRGRRARRASATRPPSRCRSRLPAAGTRPSARAPSGSRSPIFDRASTGPRPRA